MSGWCCFINLKHWDKKWFKMKKQVETQCNAPAMQNSLANSCLKKILIFWPILLKFWQNILRTLTKKRTKFQWKINEKCNSHRIIHIPFYANCTNACSVFIELLQDGWRYRRQISTACRYWSRLQFLFKVFSLKIHTF